MVNNHELTDRDYYFKAKHLVRSVSFEANKLRNPYFQHFIYSLIESWCDEHGSDVDSCIQEINEYAMIQSKNTVAANDVIEIDGHTAIATDVIEITGKE